MGCVPVTNSRHSNSFLFHAFDKLIRRKTLQEGRKNHRIIQRVQTRRHQVSKVLNSYSVISILKVPSSVINGTTESRSDSK